MNGDLICTSCRHDWHGLACVATRWLKVSRQPTPCSCATSITTDTTRELTGPDRAPTAPGH